MAMKRIGIIGGMSWESTAKYYQWLNQGVRERLGGLHSAKIMLASVDFAEIEKLQAAGDWDMAGKILAEEARNLEKGGADLIILATNTMHKVADDMQSAITVPFLHLADATAARIKSAGLSKIALLATIYTMEQDFYKSRLEKENITVLVPEEKDRQEINRIIFEELCMGQVKESSREFYIEAVNRLLEQGAEGVILGCTEITMLIGAKELPNLPIFDTTRIHVEAALEEALT